MVVAGDVADEWAICGICACSICGAFNVVGCEILSLPFNFIFVHLDWGMLMNVVNVSLPLR